MYTLIMLNSQGASETTHHDTVEGCINQTDNWADPENMTARIIDNHGQELYDNNAGVLFEEGNITDAIDRLERDNEN
jgi:hypothetical protein